MNVQKFKSTWNLGFLSIFEFVIISDRKTISQRLLTFFIWFEVHIQPFFNSTTGLNIWNIRCSSNCVDCSCKFTRKLIRNILGSVDKPIVAGHCMFPLTNLFKGQIVGFVPISNPANILRLCYVCSANLKFVRQFFVRNLKVSLVCQCRL